MCSRFQGFRVLLSDLLRRIDPLDQAVQQAAGERAEAVRLMTPPGVGPITALAFVLIIGDPTRFANSKNLASFLGLIPAEFHLQIGKRALVGKATATAKTKSPLGESQKPDQNSPQAPVCLDNADLVIHGLRLGPVNHSGKRACNRGLASFRLSDSSATRL